MSDASYKQAVAEDKVREKANDPHLTVRARQWSIYGPVLLTGAIAIGAAVGGWGWNRMVGSFDKLSDNVLSIKDDVGKQINDVKQSVTILQGQVNGIQQHDSDITNVMDKRIDALSERTRKNADDINDMQKRLYSIPIHPGVGGGPR